MTGKGGKIREIGGGWTTKIYRQKTSLEPNLPINSKPLEFCQYYNVASTIDVMQIFRQAECWSAVPRTPPMTTSVEKQTFHEI